MNSESNKKAKQDLINNLNEEIKVIEELKYDDSQHHHNLNWRDDSSMQISGFYTNYAN